MDVRMLGSGRPFMFEIINARASMPDQAALDAMQDAQNKVTQAMHVWPSGGPAADWSACVQGSHGVRVQHLQGRDRSLTDQMKVSSQN